MTNTDTTHGENSNTIVPNLYLSDGRVIVTSLKVAEDFGKLHKHVLRDIAEIVDNCPKEFGQTNFELSFYFSVQNKSLPMYNLTRDGFMLLAMRLNCVKALAFKIAYIYAFSRVEELLIESQIETTVGMAGISHLATSTHRFNDVTAEWLKNVCGQSEAQITSFGNTVLGCMQNFNINIFNEAENKDFQEAFVKGLLQLLHQTGANGHFVDATPERNYFRLMAILTGYVEKKWKL